MKMGKRISPVEVMTQMIDGAAKDMEDGYMPTWMRHQLYTSIREMTEEQWHLGKKEQWGLLKDLQPVLKSGFGPELEAQLNTTIMEMTEKQWQGQTKEEQWALLKAIQLVLESKQYKRLSEQDG